MPIQHTVFFKFEGLTDAAHLRLLGLLMAFNNLPGIRAQFFAHGEGIEGSSGKVDFLESVSWPDKTGGFTHCLLIVAKDDAALEGYLHSKVHKVDWLGATKVAGGRTRANFSEPRQSPPS
jgi:hypothetical protein